MWLGATAIYRPAAARSPASATSTRARRLFGLALMLVGPLGIYDRTHGAAMARSNAWALAGVALAAAGMGLGVAALRALGSAYS